jgi:5,10-methenyltetrahydromethanopterin hydrogenase
MSDLPKLKKNRIHVLNDEELKKMVTAGPIVKDALADKVASIMPMKSCRTCVHPTISDKGKVTPSVCSCTGPATEVNRINKATIEALYRAYSIVRF